MSAPSPTSGADGQRGGRRRARPLRSVLFVPGHRTRWIAPARASGVDGIIFDLEDAVPVAELPRARRTVRATMDEFGHERPALFARIGVPGSQEQRDDLDAVVCAGMTGVMIPWVHHPDEVKAVDERLSELEAERGLPAGSILIWPLMETANAVRLAYELAVSSPRVEYMGGATTAGGDLARSLRFRWTPGGTETYVLRSMALLHVRAAGLEFPVSGLWTRADDQEGLRRFAGQTRDLGYSGMLAIHPSQVAIINEVFSPSAEEIAEWRRVIGAMRAAQAEGVGAVRDGGDMIDEAHVRTAMAELEIVELMGLDSQGGTAGEQ